MCSIRKFEYKIGNTYKFNNNTLCIYGIKHMESYLEQKYIDEMFERGFEIVEQYENGVKLFNIHKKLNMFDYTISPCDCGRPCPYDDGKDYYHNIGNHNNDDNEDKLIFKIDGQYEIYISNDDSDRILYKQFYDNKWCYLFWHNHFNSHNIIYDKNVHIRIVDNCYYIVDFNKLKTHNSKCRYSDRVYNHIVDDNIDNIIVKYAHECKSANVTKIYISKRKIYNNCIVFYSISWYSENEITTYTLTKMMYDMANSTCKTVKSRTFDISEIIACLDDGNIVCSVYNDKNDYYREETTWMLLDSDLETIYTIDNSIYYYWSNAKNATVYNNSQYMEISGEMGEYGSVVLFGFEWERRKIPIIANVI